MKWGYHLRVAAALALSLLPLTPARAETAPAAPSTEQLQQLVATLKDDKARAQLVVELQALIAAQNAENPAAAAPAAAWYADLPAQLNAVGAEVLAAAPILMQAPRLYAWVETQVSDPDLRQRWFGVVVKLVVIFGAGFVADAVARFLLRRPAALLAARSSATPAIRASLLALAAAVEVLPVLIFAGVAAFVMPLTEPNLPTREVARLLVAATVWARGLLAVARIALLSPAAEALYALDEETRNYLYIWMRRFAYWAAYGYAVSAGAWWLGAPGAINGLLFRVIVLVLAILAIIFVLQNRTAVANWLRGRERAGSGWRALRHRLAETWHVIAIIYVVGTFGVYVLNAQGGINLLLRATALSLVVVAAAALLTRFVDRALRGSFAVNPALKIRFPGIEARANRYLPIVTGLSAAVIYALAALALLQAWDIDAFAWLGAVFAQRATGSIVALAVVIVIGVVLWEFLSTMIERRLARINHTGRSRARTLLPLLRTTALVVFLVIAALMVLSELGLDIGPLLAGAGIAGVAVGFGAQALVKDIITGFFVLLEDTFAIGDLVDVGKGHVGMVEAVSMRNFRLRDGAGIVHVIPFSEVSIVLNMSRDFAYVVCDAGIVYGADPDRAIAAMREAGDALAADPQWTRYVMAPLEILGLERFTDTGMVIRARIKAVPPRQFELAHEYNRLLKKAFDRHGIEMASVNQIDYLARQRPEKPSMAAPTPSASV